PNGPIENLGRYREYTAKFIDILRGEFKSLCIFVFFSSRRRHTRWPRDWSSDVCSSDLARDDRRSAIVTIDKGLPVSGGIGGSAASSVAGAYAAALACGVTPSPEDIILAALAGEEVVSDRKSVV